MKQAHAKWVPVGVEPSAVSQRFDKRSEEEQAVTGINIASVLPWPDLHRSGSPFLEEVEQMWGRNHQESDHANDTQRERWDIAVLPQRGIATLGIGVGRSVITHLSHQLVARSDGAEVRDEDVKEAMKELLL
jgi:hypothetical protein